MRRLNPIYRTSLGLLTDLYQLTMAAGYWKTGRADWEAVFHLSFRENPFGGGFAIACGLAAAVDFLQAFSFDAEDRAYLAEQRGADGAALFDPRFLDHLAGRRFRCDLDAVEEGTVVFANEPLVRVRGPILECQLVETALLTMVNFETLIATKAARVVSAASGDPVIEFGLRRAQGIDGGLSASRAAFVGGCAGTSNTLAGRLFGIPVGGTHAHSWIMCFHDELEAMRAYAEALPNNCIFLVDTYDTLAGVHNAVRVGRLLRERGREMIGIRLDSGDLAALSAAARRILDEAGFPDAKIVASNRSRRIPDRGLEGRRGEDRCLGRWHSAGDCLRSASPGRGLQAGGHPAARRRGKTASSSRTTPPRRPRPASSRSAATRIAAEAIGDCLFDERPPVAGHAPGRRSPRWLAPCNSRRPAATTSWCRCFAAAVAATRRRRRRPRAAAATGDHPRDGSPPGFARRLPRLA